MNILSIILIIVIVGLVAYHLYTRKRHEQQLKELTEYLVKVQDRGTIPRLQEQTEGELKVLQSEVYKLVTNLQEQYTNENEKNKYLAEMLSNISHQLKTPLTAITLFTDHLKNDAITLEEKQVLLDKITSETDHITWLVRTLLTIAQLDAGVLILKKEAADLTQILKELSSSYEIIAELQEVDWELVMPEQVPIVCDVNWTKEAISNVLRNCLDHTPAGGKVQCLIRQSNLSTELLISDTGVGIAKQDLPHVFERFYRSNRARKESHGLGLALTKQLLLNQQATITVDSQEGHGTRFTIIFYR